MTIETSAGQILRGQVKNGVSMETITIWLEGLGEFEEIRPADAAERWGVTVREAMERLHAMVGAVLQIPRGEVERYQYLPPAPFPAAKVRDTLCSPEEKLMKIPPEGATASQLAEIWGISKRAAGKCLAGMARSGKVVPSGTGAYGSRIWRRRA